MRKHCTLLDRVRRTSSVRHTTPKIQHALVAAGRGDFTFSMFCSRALDLFLGSIQGTFLDPLGHGKVTPFFEASSIALMR